MADILSGIEALAGAAPEEVDAHRNLLTEALGVLQGQGVDTSALIGAAGSATSDPQQMGHENLVQTTMALAAAHPEVVNMVAARFPAAQGLIRMMVTRPQGAKD